MKMILSMIGLAFLTPAISVGSEPVPPIGYMQSKLANNDILFLGTRHKQPEILNFLNELIPTLNKLGVTHLGLEIPSDEQGNIDNFMATGSGLSDIRLHTQVDCPEYRNLFRVLKEADGPEPVAIDLPYARYDEKISRDEWMAQSLLGVLQKNPSAKILVKVGNLHILKILQWQGQTASKHLSVREYIKRKRPGTKLFSVGQAIGESGQYCDFTKIFGPLPGAVAFDLGYQYKGWKFGITSDMAIEPAECFEIMDGLIVY